MWRAARLSRTLVRASLAPILPMMVLMRANGENAPDYKAVLAESIKEPISENVEELLKSRFHNVERKESVLSDYLALLSTSDREEVSKEGEKWRKLPDAEKKKTAAKYAEQEKQEEAARWKKITTIQDPEFEKLKSRLDQETRDLIKEYSVPESVNAERASRWKGKAVKDQLLSVKEVIEIEQLAINFLRHDLAKAKNIEDPKLRKVYVTRVIQDTAGALNKGSRAHRTDLDTFIRSLDHHRSTSKAYRQERKLVMRYHEKLVTKDIQDLEVEGVLGKF